MKKLLKYILILLFFITIFAGGYFFSYKIDHSTQNTQKKIQFQDTSDFNINKVYDLGEVQLEIDQIKLLKSNGKLKFNTIDIIGKITVDNDNIIWSPENSTIILNHNERTIPMLMQNLNIPLNKTINQPVELMAYVTQTELNNIEVIDWHVTHPVVKSNNDYTSDGSDLNLTFNLKEIINTK